MQTLWDFATRVKKVGSNQINKVKSVATTVWGAVTSELVVDAAKYCTGQFVEGFKSIATFPFTIAKMPFTENGRQLIKETTKYNFIYYCLPAI